MNQSGRTPKEPYLIAEQLLDGALLAGGRKESVERYVPRSNDRRLDNKPIKSEANGSLLIERLLFFN